jgi:hypothetical protein
MTLFGRRFSSAKSLLCWAGALARQTLQFDEDRDGPLTAISSLGWRRDPGGAETPSLSLLNQMFTMKLPEALECG